MSEIIRSEQPRSWLEPTSIEDAMKMAEYMAGAEDMVPKAYRGKPKAVFMAMVKAKEMNLGVSTVLENNYPIEGSLAWKSTFLIQYANASGQLRGPIKFHRLEEGTYKIPGRAAVPAQPANEAEGRRWPSKPKPAFPEMTVPKISYQAYGTLADGTEVKGMVIGIDTATKAGWVYNNPAQWVGDMENMLYQRAAKRFCNMYGIGINELSIEEARDIDPRDIQDASVEVIDNGPAQPKPNKIPITQPEPQAKPVVEEAEVVGNDAAESKPEPADW